MMKFVKSPLLSGLLGGSLFLVTLVLVVSTAANKPAHTPDVPVPEAAIWNPQNAEVDQLVSQLKKEREELHERATGLKKLEEQLKTERLELDEITQRVKAMQDQFNKNVVQLKGDELANLKKQAKMYATMAPDAAAQIMAEMEDSAVVKLLATMKEEESASILEGFLKRNPQSAKRVALLSDQLRRVLVEKVASK
jgi:flagellar motility protein MotE (MotC chaperone)